MNITDPNQKPKPRSRAGSQTAEPEFAAKALAADVSQTPPQMPDLSRLPEIMLKISSHCQKLLQEFIERNPDITNSPEMPSFAMANVGDAFLELGNRLINSPEKLADAQIAYWQDYIKLCKAALARMSGEPAPPVIAPAANDKRFQDKAWQEIWLFDFIKQSYLLTARWMQGVVNKTADLNPKLKRKLDFYTRQITDAMAPSNFWMTNPEVLRTTIETGGENLIKGFENMLADLERGQGKLMISMSDNSAFKFGENIATTEGRVVFQNELIQLIQYVPLTEQVHETPLLIMSPWINKYYILDLREKNSYIRYLVNQGYTVFCISWVNPDQRHARINFEDYMTLGCLAAAQAIGEATNCKNLNIVGYCIGGTLLASSLAYLEALGDKRPKNIPHITSATYLVTLVDFAEAGELGVFIDEAQISNLESRMAKQGYLDAATLGMTFNMLRSNDLIWSFVVNNYLLGREPFPFDLLTWNSDSTNLPAAMHSFYLRHMYLENKLVEPDGLTLKGVPIDLRQIKTPSFLLSTRDDHIAPWRSTYAATQLYQGPVTFCLSGSGHIAGVINPPIANKYGYWVNDKCPAHPEDWFNSAVAHSGSWWPEWLKWLMPYSGKLIPARIPADGVEAAPGSYVKVRVV